MTLWQGPLIDGITQSMLTKFYQCPYRFYLYAILGLKDNKPLNENLIWGDVFHKGLEHLIQTKDLNASVVAALEYLDAKYPQAPKTYEVSIRRLLYRFPLASYSSGTWQTEIPFRTPVTLPSGREVTIRGKVDAICTDHPQYGLALGEHKCKGYIDPPKLAKELFLDRQVNIYCYLHNIEWVNYDLILIPESLKYKPARNFNESPQEYMERLFVGPCGSYGTFPINQNQTKWIYNGTYHLPRERQEQYWNETVYPELERICHWWDWVTQSNFDHENPKFYNHIFYKTPIRQFDPALTTNFECDYYNHLIGEEDLSDLPDVGSLYHELENL